jgi:hypothetical protein
MVWESLQIHGLIYTYKHITHMYFTTAVNISILQLSTSVLLLFFSEYFVLNITTFSAQSLIKCVNYNYLSLFHIISHTLSTINL